MCQLNNGDTLNALTIAKRTAGLDDLGYMGFVDTRLHHYALPRYAFPAIVDDWRAGYCDGNSYLFASCLHAIFAFMVSAVGVVIQLVYHRAAHIEAAITAIIKYADDGVCHFNLNHRTVR